MGQWLGDRPGDVLVLTKFVGSGLVTTALKRQTAAIDHVDVIRIGTRVPVFLPMRITTELTVMLQKYHPLWMNIHFNHAREMTPEVARACAQLADAGIPLGAAIPRSEAISNL